MTQFRDGFISAESYQAADPAALMEGAFDIAYFVPSWDERCRCIMQASGLRANVATIVRLAQFDDEGRQDAHTRDLLAYAESISREQGAVSSEPGGITDLWARLRTSVLEARRDLGRPLEIMMDMSTCPRFLSLALLALALSPGVARRLTLFYSEGTYPGEPHEESQKHELFTRGNWNAIPVDGLVGTWDPAHSDLFVVSVGFEGTKTLRTVSRADPDRVRILFPEPGFAGDYPDRTWRSNRDLFDRFQIDKAQLLCAQAGDVVGAWRALSEACLERPLENVYYVCCGTKPHAIALGLRGLVLQHPTVLYNLPDSHLVSDTQPNGSYWRYDIQNATCL